jgi:peptide/nickel transport system ATP-binding protein
MAEPLLEIRELVTEFRTEQGTVRAVDGVSFEVPRRGTVGVVGESGCGKSVTALSIMRLIAPPGRIASGQVRYGGVDLLALPPAEMRAIRGNRIAMIFQEPMTSLNPVFTVGDQVGEAVRLHQKKSRRDARRIAIEMFRLVGIPSPEERVDAYPHQLSGGMRQRVMIAMALACKPDLLIADEPTTALDVTIQAQILDLLRSLQAELGMSILLITHDLGVVAETCDEVIVMYAGRVVERAKAAELFAHPRHPYTAGLLRSVPSYGEAAEGADADGVGVGGGGASAVPAQSGERARRPRLLEIKGMVPPLTALPKGCKFVDRCAYAQERCRAEEPALLPIGPSQVRCHFPLEAVAAVEVAAVVAAVAPEAMAPAAPEAAAFAGAAPEEASAESAAVVPPADTEAAP